MHTGTFLHLLAFDLGAESGRAMVGHFDDERLTLEEIYRFANHPVRVGEHLYTDVLNLWAEMQTGLQKAVARSETGLTSVGVDTWGVDFALLDGQEHLLGNPFHYRDPQTRGTIARALEKVSFEEIYSQTGNQLMEFNTLFQLLALQRSAHPNLEAARSLLMLPDLLNFWLSGQKASELTIASTSQCFNLRQRSWATDLLARLDLPTNIFQAIVPSGTVIGQLHAWLAAQSGCEPIPVIAPACHDTGSAVAAIPVTSPHFMYISSGTWSLVGVELEQPLINAATLAANLANEGGVGERVRLLKIVPGMWLLQQCRSEWSHLGRSYSYDELTALGASAPLFGPLLVVNDEYFIAPGDMPARIQEFCRRTGQPAPQTEGQIVRSILESLALEYRACLDGLEALLDRPLDVIHIIGGGSRNRLLNQLTADVARRPVVAGPVEATVAGNLLAQAMGVGRLSSLEELRQVMRRSFEPQVFEPQPDDRWDEAYQLYRQLTIPRENL
ncbi:MAG: rhamnulokinase [Anaerolineales bacterium]|nr:rhamnulokinase [Anaerolineales bacterium]